MSAVVLDSYALLAFFRGEPAGVAVRALLEKAGAADRPVHMTEVNYAEVKYVVLRKDGTAAWDQAAKVLEALPIEFHAVDRRLADVAAELKAGFPLSLADACAAALAKERKAELVTGDVEFEPLKDRVRIRWLQA